MSAEVNKKKTTNDQGKAKQESATFYYDNFMMKEHTTVKLLWMPPKTLQQSQNKKGGIYHQVLKGFIKTDMAIQIQNSWGNMSTFLSSFLAGSIGDVESIINSGQDFLLKANDLANTFGFDTSGYFNGDVSSLANSKVVHFTDYVKKFQGTDVNFPNNVDVMFIADEMGKDPRVEARNMLKFIMGGISTDSEVEVPPESQPQTSQTEDSANNSSAQPAERGTLTITKEKGIEIFKSSYGFITSPGHYEYDTNFNFRDPFLSMPGTLTMVIGDAGNDLDGRVTRKGIVVRNLLVDSAEMTVSKTVTIEGYPLYVNVSLALSPTSFFSAANLDVMLGGDGNWENYSNLPESDYYKSDTQMRALEMYNSRTSEVNPAAIQMEIKKEDALIQRLQEIGRTSFIRNFQGQRDGNGNKIYYAIVLGSIVSGRELESIPLFTSLYEKDYTLRVETEQLPQLRNYMTDAKNEQLFERIQDKLRNVEDGRDVIAETGANRLHAILDFYRAKLETLRQRYVQAQKVMDECLEEAQYKAVEPKK